MTQFARPDADVHDGSWVKFSGGNTDLYTMIDETSEDDADYVESEEAPSSSPVVVRLSDVTDPTVGHSHVVRYRYRKHQSGNRLDITAQLRMGYVSEGSPGTLIREKTHEDVPSSFVEGSFTLTAAETDNIRGGTGYGDLFLRFVADQP